jgi:hypothetical protein
MANGSSGQSGGDVEKRETPTEQKSGSITEETCPTDVEKEAGQGRYDNGTDSEMVTSEGVDEDGDDSIEGEEPAEPQGGLARVLSKVVSRSSTKSNPGPPPDGGVKAWTAGKTRCIQGLDTPPPRLQTVTVLTKPSDPSPTQRLRAT